MTKAQKWLSFLILASTGGIVYQVGYIRYVFLEATYQALELSAQDYGNIISVYGIVAMVSYFFGGLLSDRFSPKNLIAIAMIGTAACNFYIASVPGYTGTLIAHIVMAIMGMAFYWSALVKSIGLLGNASEQGRLFGYLEGVRGIISTVIGFVGAATVAAAIVPATGVLWLIRIYGIVAIVLGVIVLIVVKEDKQQLASAEKQSVGLKDLWLAATNPYTWLIGGTIMSIYASYTALAYFTPLLQYKFGLSVALVGVIGVVRTYVFQFVAGPISGVVSDKIAKSTPRFLRWVFIAATVILIVFLAIPKVDVLVWVALVLMFVLTFVIFAARGVYWASIGEVGIPVNQRGGVTGLAAGIAYLPDAFLPALAAWWIGDPSANPAVPEQGGGYTTLFIFLIVMCLLGLLLTTLTMRRRSREISRSTPTQKLSSNSTL